MALKKPHNEWRLPQASVLDVRAVGLDELLTRLWLRVMTQNKPLIRHPGTVATVVELANHMSRPNNTKFRGFSDAPAAAEAWLRADLVKPLRRYPQYFSVARPVHGLATRVRSSHGADDSLASLVVYGWLSHGDPQLLDALASFLELDPDEEASLDLASFALALLGEEYEEDVRGEHPDDPPAPQCRALAAGYADDLRRLMAYQAVMPRAVLVDHVRRLTGFFVGLSLLRTFRIVVDVEHRGGSLRLCEACATGSDTDVGRCPYRLELAVDAGEDARSSTARIAELAWARQDEHLARYVRSHLGLRKLWEFGQALAEDDPDQALPTSTLEEIAALEDAAPRERLDAHFGERLRSLADQAGEDGARERIRELDREYRGMGLSPYQAYVALLAQLTERKWIGYHRQLIDSLFAKNSADGALRQPLGGPRRRRIALGAGLLETLTLVAVVDTDQGRATTVPLRVDELIERFESRYDLLIGRPPSDLADDPGAHVAAAENVDRFKARLREIGLFTDLSDAFLAQTVRPRHMLGAAAPQDNVG
jgi:hypothetical protein